MCLNFMEPVSKVVGLAGTSFSGQLPTSFVILDSWNELDVSICNFTRLVPPSLGNNLTQLTYQDLSNNSFRGQISSSMENLTQLTWFDISSNDVSAETLSWINLLTKLTFLHLMQINLNSEILPSLENLTQLNFLAQQFGKNTSYLINLTQLSSVKVLSWSVQVSGFVVEAHIPIFDSCHGLNT